MDDVRFNISTDSRGNVTMTSATRVGGYRKPRTHQRFSPVKITRADGSVSVITKQTRTYNGRRKQTVVDLPRTIHASDLPAIFAD